MNSGFLTVGWCLGAVRDKSSIIGWNSEGAPSWDAPGQDILYCVPTGALLDNECYLAALTYAPGELARLDPAMALGLEALHRGPRSVQRSRFSCRAAAGCFGVAIAVRHKLDQECRRCAINQLSDGDRGRAPYSAAAPDTRVLADSRCISSAEADEGRTIGLVEHVSALLDSCAQPPNCTDSPFETLHDVPSATCLEKRRVASQWVAFGRCDLMPLYFVGADADLLHPPAQAILVPGLGWRALHNYKLSHTSGGNGPECTGPAMGARLCRTLRCGVLGLRGCRSEACSSANFRAGARRVRAEWRIRHNHLLCMRPVQ